MFLIQLLDCQIPFPRREFLLLSCQVDNLLKTFGSSQTPPAAPNATANSHKKPTIAIIIGSLIGGLFFLMLLIAMSIIIWRERRDRYPRKKRQLFPCIRAKAKGVEPFPAPFPKIGTTFASFLVMPTLIRLGIRPPSLIKARRLDSWPKGHSTTRIITGSTIISRTAQYSHSRLRCPFFVTDMLNQPPYLSTRIATAFPCQIASMQTLITLSGY